MFNPNEIIFSLTSKCNLTCAHCTIERAAVAIDSGPAVMFLKEMRQYIECVGFTGGEPLLEIDTLCKLVDAAVDLGYTFDAISTNGVAKGAKDSLKQLYDARFDGTFRISVDTYHKDSFYDSGHYEDYIMKFIDNIESIFSNTVHIEIQSTKSRDRSLDNFLETLSKKYTTYKSALSPSNTREWFSDSDCTNMGNIFFIHPNGTIAPCCGFNNENPRLFIGKITDDYDTLLSNAKKNVITNLCFNKGLSSARYGIPQSDPCVFCKKLCATYQ